MTATTLPTDTFYLADAENDDDFTAHYVPGEHGKNGYAVPRFTHTEANRIVAILDGGYICNITLRWAPDGTTLLAYDGETTEVVGPDEHGLYPIGAGEWAWEHLAETCAVCGDPEPLWPVGDEGFTAWHGGGVTRYTCSTECTNAYEATHTNP